MSDHTIEKIRNGTFEVGRRTPTGWTCEAEDPGASWRFDAAIDGAGPRSVRLQTRGDEAVAQMAQRFRCKASQWYRIEVLVGEAARSSSRGGRLTLCVETFDAAAESIDARTRRGPAVCHRPITWRESVCTPGGARAMSLTVQWSGGAGHARIGRVRCIPVDSPEIESHALSVPPPARAYPPPRAVKQVAVVAESAPTALVEALRARLGATAVTHLRDSASRVERAAADGMVFIGERLPRAIGSLKSLVALADERMVIISPQQLAHLAGGRDAGRLAVRTLRQRAEPICVKVRDSNFVTRGFALLDVFRYARFEERAGEFSLTVFERSRTARQLLEAAGFVTTLVSEAATDATSGLPVCLVRPTPHGAVVVLDLMPFESDESTENGLNCAAGLLMNALGQWHCAAGQYVVPQRDPRRFEMDLESFCGRYPPLVIEEPAGERRESRAPRVILAQRTESFGLPMPRRASVRIRTRLTERDWPGCYAAMLWLKTLVRPTPWTAPHVAALLERYEIDWRPMASAGDLSADDDAPALRIDMVRGRTMAARVVIPADDRPFYRRLEESLPRLARELLPAAPTLYRPADGGEPGDRVTCTWHASWPTITIARNDAAGAPPYDAVRIELPAGGDDGVADSVWMTELGLFLVEAAVGLHAGVLAVNRTESPRVVSVPAWAGDGRTVSLGAPDGPGRITSISTREPKSVELAPGAALLIATRPDAAPQRETALQFVSGKAAG